MEEFDIEKFQQRLKEARNKCGLTQIQVADAIGIGYTTYRKYESSKDDMHMQVSELYKISKLFNLSADELMGLKQERGRKKR